MAEKKINGRTFNVTPMLAFQGLILKARLMKVAAPVIGSLGDILGGAAEGGEAKEHAESKATGALAALFAEAEPVALATLVKDVIEVAEVMRPSGSYGPIDFDGDMTGHEADIMPLMVFVLREQFADFFTGFQGIGSLKSLAKG